MFYPAYVHSDADGSASGFFPDVPGCFFAGRSLDDAFRDAHGALNAHFELLCEMDQPIPDTLAVEQHVQNTPEEFVGGSWLLVDINLDKFDSRAERINITLPHRLLTLIDGYVKKNADFASRSAFLAEAARRVLKSGK
ncbi:type II toxin-antitoxin system HicB family antitoxin [Dryocola sp. BD626]|uniref:type II toxin-antitoxin system HicB family antitoxin n=1 Tax=Dryocola sp. BD626 TaxID=3133273 RepID=UPI003F5016B8